MNCEEKLLDPTEETNSFFLTMKKEFPNITIEDLRKFSFSLTEQEKNFYLRESRNVSIEYHLTEEEKKTIVEGNYQMVDQPRGPELFKRKASSFFKERARSIQSESEEEKSVSLTEEEHEKIKEFVLKSGKK